MDHSNTTNNRRGDDTRIAKLVSDVGALQEQMKINTAITAEVKEMVASFKMIAVIAKWLTAIIALAIAIKTGVSQFFGR